MTGQRGGPFGWFSHSEDGSLGHVDWQEERKAGTGGYVSEAEGKAVRKEY